MYINSTAVSIFSKRKFTILRITPRLRIIANGFLQFHNSVTDIPFDDDAGIAPLIRAGPRTRSS